MGDERCLGTELGSPEWHPGAEVKSLSGSLG